MASSTLKRCSYCFDYAYYSNEFHSFCSFSCAGIDIYALLELQLQQRDREREESEIFSQMMRVDVPIVLVHEPSSDQLPLSQPPPPLYEDDDEIFQESMHLLMSSSREETMEERLFTQYNNEERRRYDLVKLQV
jgi:hypothetical protein